MRLDEKFLTTQELAELCRTTPAGIANMRYRGVAPRGVRAGRRLLYPESEVIAWLERHADQPNAGNAA
jgi:predicted DNA-binding transcriptional regulator AlpA